jgi:membrane protein required for colicin V production
VTNPALGWNATWNGVWNGPWNALDWLLAAMVLLSAVRGLWRGLVQAIFGLAGVLGGFALASWEYAAAAQWVLRQGWTHSAEVAAVGCYLAILVGCMVLAGIAGAVARRAAHAVGLGGADRLLGGLLGVVRGVLLGAALVLTVHALAPGSALLLGSRLAAYFLASGHAVSFVVPHSVR